MSGADVTQLTLTSLCLSGTKRRQPALRFCAILVFLWRRPSVALFLSRILWKALLLHFPDGLSLSCMSFLQRAFRRLGRVSLYGLSLWSFRRWIGCTACNSRAIPLYGSGVLFFRVLRLSVIPKGSKSIWFAFLGRAVSYAYAAVSLS